LREEKRKRKKEKHSFQPNLYYYFPQYFFFVCLSYFYYNMQEEIMVEALLDSKTTRLVISLEFANKQGFKLKKIERSIYVRNMDSSFKMRISWRL